MRVVAGILAAGLLFAIAPVHADEKEGPPPATIQQLDSRLATLFAQGHVPGASVALVENGQVVFVKGYGYADTAKKIPVTPDTVFRAGSISKSLTSIAVMTAVEQGKLSLDDKLADRAPEVKFVNPWEASDPVRLVNLLEHTTGWADVYPKVYAMDGKGWSVLRGVQYTSPLFVSRWKPGHFPVYNNAGPAVAAVILEKATGEDFAAYMRERVLRPMGMPTADFDLPPALEARVAKSYESDGSETPYQTIILPPAGSLAATPRELAQLVRFYLGRGTVDGRQVLKPESVERIERSESTLASQSGFVNGYGLGNTGLTDTGITFHGHNGSIDSFTSVYGYCLRNGSGYVLMANGGEGVDFATPVSRLVQGYLTRNIKPQFPATVAIDDSTLQRYAGVYRTITPSNTLLRPIAEVLGFTRVSAGHGELRIGGKAYLPTGPHSFRRVDRDEPSLAFVEQGGEVYLISALGARQKTSYALFGAVLAIGFVLVVGTLIGLVLLLVWTVARLRGRARGGAMVRLWPIAGVVALVATFALPLAALLAPGMQAVHRLSDAGPYAVAIMLGSLLFPVFGALGLVSSLRANEARRFVRINAGLVSIALLAVAGYAFSIGWIGMRTWAL
ncbi:MAG TPA: serine hydrolase domain-containing protein [Xanthomonadaceae bacterium]|jgi:CubicO group peptidase (beta-lactamase class C family)